MKDIKCSECGKHLFNTDKSDGAAMSEAQGMGFVAKMPFLYGISGCFFFCDKECHKKWSEKNIPEYAKSKGDKAIAELKAKQPQMVADTACAMDSFCKALNKLKKL